MVIMEKARKIIIATVIILVVAAVGYIAWFTINNRSMPTHVLKDKSSANDTIIVYYGERPAAEPVAIVPAQDVAVNNGIVSAF